MKRVYVALGGNIGDTEKVFEQVLAILRKRGDVAHVEESLFYVTEPVSPIPQRDYLNGVCTFETLLKPRELFEVLQEIERTLGKVPKMKDAPRVIDLDIIFYGEETYQDDGLTIPHPKWREREFVTTPLNELLEKQAHAKVSD